MVNSIEELLNHITPEIYQQLKQSVELGKWPTGQLLSKEQRQLCLQAVIVYEQKNINPEERTGYIPPKENIHCGSAGVIVDDQEQPLHFKR
ncbi:hypothetical protein AB835_06815 [Candidatus Endobugula sertula]|uniref:PA-phosphatase n=1 Tax=Candidatus Endobugula sertula TaxID=62101 RepID=A0A1D2QQN5_9GAMM|nr:hypothetical protein AB835_06815 [Candidatus Endobugula sertula]